MYVCMCVFEYGFPTTISLHVCSSCCSLCPLHPLSSNVYAILVVLLLSLLNSFADFVIEVLIIDIAILIMPFFSVSLLQSLHYAITTTSCASFPIFDSFVPFYFTSLLPIDFQSLCAFFFRLLAFLHSTDLCVVREPVTFYYSSSMCNFSFQHIEFSSFSTIRHIMSIRAAFSFLFLFLLLSFSIAHSILILSAYFFPSTIFPIHLLQLLIGRHDVSVCMPLKFIDVMFECVFLFVWMYEREWHIVYKQSKLFISAPYTNTNLSLIRSHCTHIYNAYFQFQQYIEQSSNAVHIHCTDFNKLCA